MPRSWFLIPFSNKGSQSFLEKLLIAGLGQEISEVSLESAAGLASRELRKRESHTLMASARDAQGTAERASAGETEQLSHKVNKIVLDYDSKHKVSFPESILM